MGQMISEHYISPFQIFTSDLSMVFSVFSSLSSFVNFRSLSRSFSRMSCRSFSRCRILFLHLSTFAWECKEYRRNHYFYLDYRNCSIKVTYISSPTTRVRQNGNPKHFLQNDGCLAKLYLTSVFVLYYLRLCFLSCKDEFAIQK